MTEPASSIRVIVAEDNLLMRQGIVAALSTIADTTVAAECGTLPDLLAAVDEHRPDVVLTDIRMPPTLTDEGIEAARTIRAEHPDTAVIVLSQHADPRYALALFDDGSDRLGYLLKENVGNIGDLRRAIVTVCAGGSSIDPEIVGLLVGQRSERSSPLDQLTAREREVLSLIAEGLNNGAIAEQLVIAEKSVQKHINMIFSKLHLGEEPDTHSRVRAVRLWLGAED
jgi:DNA-binding NarL/FixJ family response regulator